MQFFADLKDEEFGVMVQDSLSRLLTNIENETAIIEVKASLENWRKNGIAGIPRETISLRDITLIYTAQKFSLQTFIPILLQTYLQQRNCCTRLNFTISKFRS
jgi:hypothetical protein